MDELVLPGLRDPLDLTSERQSFAYDVIELRSWHVDLRRLRISSGKFVDLLSPNARYQLRKSMQGTMEDVCGSAGLIEARSS